MHGVWRSCHRDGRARPSAPRHATFAAAAAVTSAGFSCVSPRTIRRRVKLGAGSRAGRFSRPVAHPRGERQCQAGFSLAGMGEADRPQASGAVARRLPFRHRFIPGSLSRCGCSGAWAKTRREAPLRRGSRAGSRSVCTRRSHAISAQANLPVAATTTGPDLPARQLAREQSQGRAPTHGTTRSRRAVLDLFGVPFTGMRTKHREGAPDAFPW